MHYETGKAITVQTKDTKISRITFTEGLIKNCFIAPGLVDLQVNGYKGIDFNREDLTVSEVSLITRLLLKEGVTSFYPTIVTGSLDKTLKLCSVIAQAVEVNQLVQKSIKGIHLEGPFISAEDGPRGAHAKQHICPPDWLFIEKVQQAARGLVKIITLAPEWQESPLFIKKAVEQNLVVAIGHTAASSAQIKAAIKAGASFSTHLGNGAHPVMKRHPNYIWDQLAEDSLAATVIADGFHLPMNVLRVISAVKKEKMLLVSDSVALAGEPPGEYETAVGGRVCLTKEGRLHLATNEELLAGSSFHLRQCVEKLVEEGITSLSSALNLASIHPARMVGLDQQKGLLEGAMADFILYQVDHSGRLIILKTIKEGEVVYTSY
ncbi:amidohydrolase family protein [Bacillus sp. JCM 19041]|uniref:N-acetylglucosamine-6-phosphate deacetylase n=1 Tax=Bacillus sp. JCM 19041 TaxID=1460637 RepID=UPI000B23A49B